MPTLILPGRQFIKPPAGAVLDTSNPLTRGLIASWDGLERRSIRAANSVLANSRINGKVGGTYNQKRGDTFEPWTFNGGWYYDVTGPSAQFYNMPGSFSIETLFKTSASGLQILFGAQNVSSGNGWTLANNGGNKLELNYWSGSADQRVATTLGYNDGKWHHLVGIRDVVHAASYLYIDGTLVAATTGLSTNEISITAARVFIGTTLFGGGPAFTWGGSLAYIRIWRGRALRPGDIRKLYSDPFSIYRPTGLIERFGAPPPPQVEVEGDVLLSGLGVSGSIYQSIDVSGDIGFDGLSVSGGLESRVVQYASSISLLNPGASSAEITSGHGSTSLIIP